MRERKDLTGQVHGSYTIKEYLGWVNGDGIYKCECNFCGEVREITRSQLRYTKCICDCEKERNDDYVGRVVGDFKVIHLCGTNTHGNRVYECKCNHCGRTELKSRDLLYRTKCLCECKRKERDSFINSRVGDLEIIDRVWEHKDSWLKGKYVCKCVRCGEKFMKTKQLILSGKGVCTCRVTRFNRIYGDIRVLKVQRNPVEKGYSCICECIHCGKRLEIGYGGFNRHTVYCECQGNSIEKNQRVGRVYGDYRVLKVLDKKKHGNRVCECECIYCGKKIERLSNHLEKALGVCDCRK